MSKPTRTNSPNSFVWECIDHGVISQVIYCGGFSGEVPPLPIPNREVKLTSADGTDIPVGRVGRRRSSGSPDIFRCPGIFFLSITGTSNDARESFDVYPGGIFRCRGNPFFVYSGISFDARGAFFWLPLLYAEKKSLKALKKLEIFGGFGRIVYFCGCTLCNWLLTEGFYAWYW